ncbi:MAG: radical SAM protein [Promethearchaeota archaeon]
MSIIKLLSLENITKGLALGYYLLRHKIKKVPIAVNYDLTWNCNLRCKHCYFYSSTSELSTIEKSELTDQEWLAIFKYHSDMGVSSCALTGGEPTLRMRLLKEAVKYFSSVQIASNGIIKLPRLNYPNKEPIYWVSLDGCEKTHNSIRGANIFQKVMNNIENDKRVLISMTINSFNYKEILETIKIAHDANVSGFFFLFYTGYDNDILLLKGEKLKKVSKSILKAMRDYGDFILISKKMLELFITKEFVKSCVFKKQKVVSYYPNGQKKFCVMGNSPLLCKNCGCIVPVASYALSKLDSETIDKIKKFPF